MASYLTLLRRHKASIVIVMALAVLLAGFATFLRPFEYRTSFSVLVLENTQNVDGYTAAKAAERLSTSLSQAVYTASFAEQVTARLQSTGLAQESALFPNDEQKRRDAWKQHVETRLMTDVGTLKISVYSQDRKESADVAQALGMTLVEQGKDYLGGSNDVAIKIVDFPLTSKNPARPNIPQNLIVGLLLGFFVAVGYHLVADALQQLGAVAQPDDVQPEPQPAEPVVVAEQPVQHVVQRAQYQENRAPQQHRNQQPRRNHPAKYHPTEDVPHNLPFANEERFVNESVVTEEQPYFDRTEELSVPDVAPAPQQDRWQMP